MRLICPNCDAEYDVDDSVIPYGGREVKCSSCEKSWFQQSAHMPTEQSQEETAVPAQEAAPESEPVPDPTPPTTSNAHLDVLREEAKREHQARRNESLGGPAQQPGPAPETSGKGPVQQSAAATGDRATAPSGPELDPDFVKEIERNVARSQLLPDIEEISPTLRTGSVDEKGSNVDQPTAPTPHGRNFRMGFGTVLTIATFMVLAYIYAPLIVQEYPQTEPYLIRYVEAANDIRLWLDQMMKLATEKMSGGT